jgi:hypothetical protein
LENQPDLPNSDSSSDSSSDSLPSHSNQPRIMPSVFSKFNSATIAIVEQESNSKPPYMRVGDPTPQTCVDWERACKCFVNNKDIPADKVVKRTLDGIEDIHFVNWIKLEREDFEGMTLEEFMMLFRKMHLPNHWQDDTHITLSRMHQDTTVNILIMHDLIMHNLS